MCGQRLAGDSNEGGEGFGCGEKKIWEGFGSGDNWIRLLRSFFPERADVVGFGEGENGM
jgi:hypothetical protein